MNPKNRWVKMADVIPWEIFEKKYSRLFKGTLMLDATCAPSNIRYPQNFSLLNEAREKLRPSSFVSAKVMDFQDHVCIANKPERTILHLQRQRNAALRKSEQPSVNSGLGFGRKIVEIKAKNV